jgi:DNA-directed RNA polymerase specialized sigma24 family protein
MTKEKLIVHLCLDDIIKPDHALRILASEIGLADDETEAFISKIASHFKNMSGKARWTNQDDDTIVLLYEEGYVPKDIAEKLGRTVASINQRIFLLRQSGRSLPTRRPRMLGNAYAHKEVS